jgi:predicted DCC family thiol-disulfide oxidoreductase YuxK
VLVVANQKPGALERYGLTREEADRAAWTVDGQGRKLEGAAAINRTLDELGGGWRLLAAFYRLKPLAAVQEAVYRYVAPRRSRLHHFGITPECDDPGAGCA